MIILSYNFRGLGRGVKWAAVRRLIVKHKVHLVCLQETKRENFNKSICQAISGDSTGHWDFVPSVEAVGGLLCMWNNSTFVVERKEKGRSFLMLEGTCCCNNQKLIFVNVYAPCDLVGKKALWDELRQLKASNPSGMWCFLGDFNSIRSSQERISLSQRRADPYDIAALNQWIDDMELQEIKCSGNSFTWIRPNGCVKSRLDRFLVSQNWLSLWPESCQTVLQRNLSDHCPSILQTNMVDWGPKPFMVFDWWLQQKGYQKMWSKAEGNINPKKVLNIQQKLNEVEDLTAHRNLTDQEIKDKTLLQQELWNASNAFESLLRQKSRARWLKEGDYNTAYFHKYMNFRRAYNNIPGIFIYGEWIQQPDAVKNEAAANFFHNRFTEQMHSRPTLDGVHFKSIS
ncbi:uncharacterized protein LOC114389777 [Glycine soja]|uniref:uncharacterized protein LOC114389777 n=1 Tax=Glycine soja TaxID=3848 RepID=UPI00103EF4AF|nr:uncharacterized protein LOC114389777 [Glycine soja]